MTLTCQAIARPHDCCHRACKQPKPARSKAMPVTKDSHHNDRCSRPTRHSQPNTTTSPVSKAPAARLLRLFSADAWKAKYSAPLEIFKQFLKGINAPVRSSAEFPNLYHARARAILTSCRSSTGRKFFGELTVELSILHPHDHHDQQNNQQNANDVPDPTSPTLDTSS